MDGVKSCDGVLADLSLRLAENDGPVRGAAISRYRGGPRKDIKTTSSQHILIIGSRFPARFERSVGQHNSLSYVRVPDALSLVPAGVCPLISTRSDFEMVACALDFTLVDEIDTELDRRPAGELRIRTNFQDSAAQQLLKLLFTDLTDGYPASRLYADHLIHALAYRFLVMGREDAPSSAEKQVSPLPRHILRRVIEQMRNFESKLSLQMLAKESGYSRVHFVRMFRAATGCSPHNYLLNLRLERARELLKNPSISLIDIALDCGFSSHSHMSRLFHKSVGVTPSAYRRSLRH